MGPVEDSESLKGSAWSQTGSGSSNINPLQDLLRTLGQVAWAAEIDEEREADWDMAAVIQILPETQTQYPSSAL